MMVTVSGASSTHIGNSPSLAGATKIEACQKAMRALADEVMEEDHAGEGRAQRQHAQRHQHRQRRFMDLFQLGGVMLVMPVRRFVMRAGIAVGEMLMIQPAIAAMEGHQELAPGIEAGHARRERSAG